MSVRICYVRDHTYSTYGAATLLLILTPLAGRYKLLCGGLAMALLLVFFLGAMIELLQNQARRNAASGFEVVIRNDRDPNNPN
jgi:hypothetical protein